MECVTDFQEPVRSSQAKMEVRIEVRSIHSQESGKVIQALTDASMGCSVAWKFSMLSEGTKIRVLKNT